MLDSGALRPLLFHNPAMTPSCPPRCPWCSSQFASLTRTRRSALRSASVRCGLEAGEAVHCAFDAEHADPAMTPAFAVETGPVAREVCGEGEAQRGEGAAHPLVGVSTPGCEASVAIAAA